MYEIKENIRKIGGVEIPTWSREIYNANILSVEAGTNGYQGGDTGHGSRTYLRIQDEGSTDIHVQPITDRFGSIGFEVSLGGDAELETFIEALRLSFHVLKEEATK